MEPKLYILLVLVAGTLGGPIETITRDDACAQTCTDNSKFRYEPGKTYEFQYEAATKTSMQDASEGHSGFDLSLKAHVEVMSKCEMALKVTDVSLTETNPDNPTQKVPASRQAELRRLLEAYPLRFSFQDGRVAELCPATSEEPRVLNLKRGILSTFQNSMDDFQRDQRVKETDVSGECDADYRVGEKKWYSFVIRKSKNLLGCNDGHEYYTSIQGTPYRVQSDIQSLPLVKSSHECEQEIGTDNLLKSAKCVQAHVFRPFSREQSGAVTTSEQTLTALGARSGVSRSSTFGNRVSMLYQHSEGTASEDSSRKALEKKMMELCENTRTDIRPETPALFSGIVQVMRVMDSRTMKQVYTQISSGSLCSYNQDRVRKFFLDAIPMVGTADSLRIITDLITNNEVTGLEADMWLTSLAFVRKPTSEMIAVTKPLLSLPGDNGKVMLAVSSLVNNFCKREASCVTDSQVISVISTLEQKIGSGCSVTTSNKNKIVFALRSIGNAGNAQRASATIDRCFSNAQNPIEVRLAAVEAYRRITCDADRRQLMTLFQTKEEDSELRIAAYLAIMECPSESVLNYVKTTLESEEVNQVGSFVWSHLTNLMETSDPLKQDIRSILEDEVLRKEFNLDQRKYSRNYEGSFFLDRLNTGAKVESNLIWSSGSFVPRSAMLNLTFDLFGHSVNFFEVGGRIEGFEYFLESYFGPNGYFGADNVRDATQKSVRTVRPDKINRIDKQFGKPMDRLRGAMFVRVFGNELRYKDFDGVDSLFGDGDFNILELLLQLSKNHDYSYTQSYMFLDSSMVIPTSIGFPMNLTVNGSATIDLKASGKMDLRKLASSPCSLSINGIVQPSGAVEISSMMSVDALVTKSGLKMVSTLHSSSALQGRVELNGGRILSAEFNVPQEKIEIFDVKTAFFMVHNEEEREQKMITDNRQVQKLCSGANIARITGMELCAEMQFPNASMKSDSPYFPFTGPVSAEISLNKRDTHTGYKLESKLISNRDGTRMRMAFNTPGSTVDRALSLDLDLNKVAKSVDVSLASPWKKAALKGAYVNEASSKSLTGSFIWDEDREWAMTMELSSGLTGEITRYIPRVEIRRPGAARIALTGSVEYQPIEMLDVALTLSGITTSPIVTKATTVFREAEKSAKGSISYTSGKDYSFEARVLKDKADKTVKYQPFLSVRTPGSELVALGGSAEYTPRKNIVLDLTLDKVFKKAVTLSVNMMQALSKRRTRYNTKVDLKSIILTTKMVGTVDCRNNRVSTSLKLDYNSPRLTKNSVSFSGKWIDATAKDLKKHKINANMEVRKNPELNFKLDMDMNFNDRHTEGMVDVHYGENLKDDTKRVYLLTSLNHDLALAAASADYNMKLIFPPQDIDVQLKGDHKHDRKALQTNVVLRYGKKENVQTSLRLKNKSGKRMDLSADYSLSYPSRDIQISNTLVQTGPVRYVNTLSAQLESGKKGSMISTYRQPGDSEWAVTSEMQIPGWEPITVSGDVDLNPNNFKAQSALQMSGDKKYALTVGGKYAASIARFTGDLQYPTRHITMSVQGKRKGTTYTTCVTTDWDVDRDSTKRIEFNGLFNPQSFERMDGEAKLQLPSRTLMARFKHSGGESYASHGEAQWGPNKRITLDSTFSNNPRTRKIDAKFQMTSPFENFEMLDIDVNRQTDRLHYNSTLDIMWSKTKKLSTSVSMKHPISFSHIEGSIVGKTPFTNLERYLVYLNHNVDKTLTSSAKVTWNSDTVHLDVKASNNYTDTIPHNMAATVGLTTTIAGMESVQLAGGLKYDGHKLENSLSYDNSGRVYSYNGEATYYRYGGQLQTNGEVTVRTPYARRQSTWKHRNTFNDIHTTVNNDWGLGTRSSLRIEGAHQMSLPTGTSSLTIGLQTPAVSMRDLLFTLSHEHRTGYINSNVDFKQNSVSQGAAAVSYTRNNGQVNSEITLTSPFTDALILTLNSQHNTYPVSGHMQFQWAPARRIVVDGSYSTDSLYDDVAGNVRMTSPFRNFENVVMNMKHTKEGLEYVSTGAVEYGNSDSIKLESRIRMDRQKSALITLDTPFTAMRHLQTEAAFSGDLSSFHAKANIEAHPLFGKSAVITSWSTYNTIMGNIRVDMPIRDYEYVQMSFECRPDGVNRKSNINIEYRPRKVIKIETSMNTRNIQNMDGSIKITSPCPEMPYVAAAFEHKGSFSNFQSHAEIETSIGKKTQFDVDFLNSQTKRGSILLKRPGSPNIQSAFNVEGDISNLRAHGEASYGRNKRLTSDVTIRLSPTINVEVSVETPFNGFENVRAIATHEGGFRRFQSHAELAYSKYDKYAGDIIFSVEPTITGEVVVSTPITDYTNNRVTFSHEGSLVDFHSNMDITIGPISGVRGDMRFRSSPTISAEATLNTPLAGYESMRGALSHEGTISKFVSHAEVVYGGDRIEGDVNFDTTSRIFGEATIKTPFTGYENMQASMSHTGDLFNFNSQAGLNIDQRPFAAVKAMLNTNRGIVSEITITSPIVDYETSKASISLRGSPTNFKGNFETLFHGDTIDANLIFRSVRGIQSSFVFKSPYARTIKASLTQSGTIDDFDGKLEVTYGRTSVVTGTSKFSLNSGVSGSLDLSSQFLEPIQVTFSGNGGWSDSRGELQVTYGTKRVELQGTLNAMKDVAATVSLTSPFEGFEDVRASVSHGGSYPNFHTHAELIQNSQKIESDLHLSSGDSIEGKFVLKTPITGVRNVLLSFEHSGSLTDFRSQAEYQLNNYQSEAEIEFHLTTAVNGRASLKLPYMDDIVVSFNHRGTMYNFQTQGEMTYAGSRQISVDVSSNLEASKTVRLSVTSPIGSVDGRMTTIPNIEGSLSIETPYTGFEDISGLFTFENADGMQTHGEITYAPGKKVQGDITTRFGNRFEASAKLRTPIPDWEQITASVMHGGSMFNSNSHAEVTYGINRIEADMSYAKGPTTTATATVKTPFNGYENLAFSYKRQGGSSAMTVDTELTCGSKAFTWSTTHRATSSHLESSMRITTPYTEDISMRVEYTGIPSSFRTTGTAAMGDMYKVVSTTSFINNEAAINFDTDMMVTVSGRSRSASAEFKHKKSWSNIESSAAASYANKRVEGKVEMTLRDFSNFEATVEAKTPFRGYETTKATYRHTGSVNGIDCNLQVVYGRNSEITGTIHATTLPMQIEINVRTPYADYESLSLRGNIEKRAGRYSLEGEVSYQTGKTITLNSAIDLNSIPKTLSFSLKTPYAGFESTVLNIRVSGQMKTFRTSADFESSFAPTMSVASELRYRSITDIDGSLGINTGIENFENLKLAVNNGMEGDKYVTHTEATWNTQNRISIDGSYGYKTSWYGSDLASSLRIRTPFNIFRDGRIEIEHDLKSGKYVEKLSVEYNGQKMIDGDVEYEPKRRNSVLVNVREPQPMRYSANGYVNGGKVQGEILLNWNTDDMHSNIQLETTYNNNGDKKNFVSKVISSTRTVSATGTMENTPTNAASKVDVFWDEVAGKGIGYDMEWNDNSRRSSKQQDGRFKVRTPLRSFQVSGTLSDNGRAKSMESAFLWDADRDQTKKIAVQSTCVPSEQGVKADVTLMMPSIGKDVKLGSEMIFGSGRVLFDGKTEFSYSPDTRKTLVVNSRLEDISSAYSSKNYSFSLGLSHPYTSVGVQFDSHVGTSDDKYSAGVNLMYLTARRNKQNLALKGEIDRLKQQMNIEMETPVKSMKIVGKVQMQAPYKVSVMNVYDGRTPVNMDITLDPARKDLAMQFNYDAQNSEKLMHFNVGYVNDSAIRAELFRSLYGTKTTDSLLALRLNTSHILHTRLHWRPSMIQDMKVYGLRKINDYGIRVSRSVGDIGSAVEEELNQKYNVIRQAAADDFEPYAAFIRNEAEAIMSQLDAAGQELHIMLQRNEFYSTDVAQVLDSAIQSLRAHYSDMNENLDQWYAHIKARGSEVTSFPLREKYEALLEELKLKVETMEQELSATYEAAFDSVSNSVSEYSNTIGNTYTRYSQMASNAVDTIANHPRTQEVHSQYQNIRDAILGNITKHRSNFADFYNTALGNAKQYINRIPIYSMSHSGMHHASSLAQTAYQQGVAAYKYWEVEENTKAVIATLLRYIREEISKEISGIRDSILNLEKSAVTVYDIENGEIQVEFYLPVALENLQSLPKLKVLRVLRKVQAMIPGYSYQISDYIPHTDYANWIPPFSASGSFSNGAIKTWDGKNYFADGRCSYVLARDFGDKNFTLVKTETNRDSMTILNNGRSIEIKKNGNVLVDGKQVDLPITFTNTTISQDGETIKVEDLKTFVVEYNMQSESYKFWLSGWYYGKTGGLLGTYDNEPSNDMMMPNRRMARNVDAFLKSWEVGPCSR